MFKSSLQSLLILSEQGNFDPFGTSLHYPFGVQYLPLKILLKIWYYPLQSILSSQTPSPPLFLASSQSLVLCSVQAGTTTSGGLSLHFPLWHSWPNVQWFS